MLEQRIKGLRAHRLPVFLNVHQDVVERIIPPVLKVLLVELAVLQLCFNLFHLLLNHLVSALDFLSLVMLKLYVELYGLQWIRRKF